MKRLWSAFIALSMSANCLADEVYIWQRQWSGELLAAIQQQGPQFTGVRFLAAQYRAQSPRLDGAFQAQDWILPDVQLVAFREQSKISLVPVIRIPGSAPAISAQQLIGLIKRLNGQFLAEQKTLLRVEIDFDCAESKLDGYAALLDRTRALLAAESSPALKTLAIDITALPAWLRSPHLAKLQRSANRMTLQVHAVTTPKNGLFDPRLAESWIVAFAKNSTKPFDISLPAYGANLLLDATGQVIGVEHEAELSTGYASSRELKTSPQAVLALLDALKARKIPNLGMVRWFRLPLESDQRAWSPATLAAVLKRAPLRAKIEVQAIANSTGGFDLRLVNTGNIEGSAPLRIAINARCQGEGISAYQFQKSALVTKQSVEIRPGRSISVAWMRCEAGSEPLKLR